MRTRFGLVKAIKIKTIEVSRISVIKLMFQVHTSIGLNENEYHTYDNKLIKSSRDALRNNNNLT